MSTGHATGGRDQDAQVRSVYRAHLNRVHGYLIYRLGGRRGIAEELTQEVFMAYVAAIRRGVVIEDPQGWLITVARNTLVASIRRTGRKPELSLPATAIDELARSEAERDALELLEPLPTDQRLAMTLRYIDDLTVADVAAAMGRSVPATESLLARARRSLKEPQR